MPTPTKVQLTGVIASADGPLANGTLVVRLNIDSMIPSVGQIASKIAVTFNLDSNGSPVTAYLWPTDVMQSGDGAALYVIRAYTANGQPVLGPDSVTLPSGATFDVSQWQH